MYPNLSRMDLSKFRVPASLPTSWEIIETMSQSSNMLNYMRS